MSVRDFLLNLLIAFGIASFVIVVAAMDSLPMWVLGVLAFLVWVIYIVIVVRDHQRDIKFPLIRYRPNEPQDRVIKAPQTAIYDQEEDK